MNLPTRVLMTADGFGGVFTYSLELVRALSGAGVEVALATMGSRLSDAQRRALARLPNVELFESDWKLEWMDEPWQDVQRAGDWLLEIEGKTAPDVVHLNGYAHAALGWYAPCLVVAHTCALSRWQALRRGPIPDALATYRQHVARGLHVAQAVIAPSHATLAALEEHYGALAHARVIANAVDGGVFAPAAKLPYVLAAGCASDDAKNLRLLAKVAPRLEWPVVVAGSAGTADQRSLALTGVRALGEVSRAELAEWLSRAAIYALPARYASFEWTVLEAAFAGCALVLGDVPSLRELWSDAAIFVDPDDEVALERMLTYLAAESERRRELSLAAAARAQSFSPARMRDGYLDVYRDVMLQRRESLEQSAACAQ